MDIATIDATVGKELGEAVMLLSGEVGVLCKDAAARVLRLAKKMAVITKTPSEYGAMYAEQT
jgi:hypothetical protein